MIDFSDFKEPKFLFLLSLFPVLGLYVSDLFDRTRRKKLVIVALVLLASRLTGYIIITDWLYVLCVLFILSAAQAEINTTNKVFPFGITFLFLLVSFVVYVFDAFGGSEKIVSSNSKDRYKVETVVISGFSGRAVTLHKLYYYPVWILVYKKIDSIREDPFRETKECDIIFRSQLFKKHPVLYDACTNEMEIMD